MGQEISFDLAIEILEITDISKVTIEDLPKIIKKAKIRWHPDRIAQYQDEAEIQKYTQNFQLIEAASELIYAYLSGTYTAGEKFERPVDQEYVEPTEVIRQNAPDMQAKLHRLWNDIKKHKYKLSMQEVVLSDGFKLKDLLTQDFKEDLAGLSVLSFTYGFLTFTIITIIFSLIHPTLGGAVAIFWFFQALACVLGFLPLSRFWLPEKVQEIMFWFINLGLGVYNSANQESQVASIWVQLLVQIPRLISVLVKYIILFPIVEISKGIVGEKIVGIVKEQVAYYAGGAEWYIEELMNKDPQAMADQELFDLSYLYGELGDFSV